MDRTNDPSNPNAVSALDPQDPSAVLALFRRVADRASQLLAENRDWSMSGRHAGQYEIDIEIDDACLSMLHAAGCSVLSEESGISGPAAGDGPQAIVVVDPLDGSTNASLGLPWCATALCLVVDGEPSTALVANLRTGERYEASRGAGATLNGTPIHVGASVAMCDAIVGVNGRPNEALAVRQYRALGSTALDIATVATGEGLDGYADFDDDMIGVWDYLAAVLILTEAGGVVGDAAGRDLVTFDHTARRRPIAAASRALFDELLTAVNH